MFKKYLIIVSCLILFIQNSYANDWDVQKFVDNVSVDIISILDSEKSSKEQKIAKLEAIFDQYVDIEWIARFVMGSYWRQLEEGEKAEYQKIYAKYLKKSYVPRFDQYSNQDIKIKKVFDEGDNEYLVRTEIISQNNTPISIDYRVRQYGNGKFLLYDIIAEGVSLITTQRSEFASVLSRKGPKFLIKRLDVIANMPDDDDE